MKKFALSALLILALSGFHCLKSTGGCNSKTPASEAGTMQSYATAQSITATTHSTGLMYQIISQGTGATPTSGSLVSVRYVGKMLDGTVFDSQTGAPVSFTLGSLITGWQVGLPLIQKGGEIKLIIPSSMAYGCSSAGSIPPNSILYFDIQLVDVQ